MHAAFDPAAETRPLSEDDVQSLRRLLDARAVAAGGMTLEMLDGYFSALIAGPVEPAPERFLPAVLGDGDWPQAEREQVLALAARLWNHVRQRVRIDPATAEGGYMPLFGLPAGLLDRPGDFLDALERSGYPLGAAWAGGFLHAVRLDLPAWQALEAREPVVRAGLQLLLVLIRIDAGDGPPPTAAQRVAMVEAMPRFLHALGACHKERSA